MASTCMCGQPTAGKLLLIKSDTEEKEVGGKAACGGSGKNRPAKAA